MAPTMANEVEKSTTVPTNEQIAKLAYSIEKLDAELMGPLRKTGWRPKRNLAGC